MEATSAERSFLTVKELAALLRVSRRTAYMLVQSGEVPSVRVRGSIRIPRAALYRQLAETVKTPA
jgi:excisionase family DNA binding protein